MLSSFFLVTSTATNQITSSSAPLSSPQLLHYKTHGDKVLDLLITDMHTLYHPPAPSHYLLPDHPADASPSDHLGNLLVPRSVPGVTSSRHYRTIRVRPLAESQIAAMGRWIAAESWDLLHTLTDVDSKLDFFSSSVFLMLNTVAPEKDIRIALDDPPWMTTRIKTVIRQRNREFDKNDKSEKWRKLMRKSKSMVKRAKENLSTNFV